jgi:hypothetical protein
LPERHVWRPTEPSAVHSDLARRALLKEANMCADTNNVPLACSSGDAAPGYGSHKPEKTLHLVAIVYTSLRLLFSIQAL